MGQIISLDNLNDSNCRQGAIILQDCTKFNVYSVKIAKDCGSDRKLSQISQLGVPKVIKIDNVNSFVTAKAQDLPCRYVQNTNLADYKFPFLLQIASNSQMEFTVETDGKYIDEINKKQSNRRSNIKQSNTHQSNENQPNGASNNASDSEEEKFNDAKEYNSGFKASYLADDGELLEQKSFESVSDDKLEQKSFESVSDDKLETGSNQSDDLHNLLFKNLCIIRGRSKEEIYEKLDQLSEFGTEHCDMEIIGDVYKDDEDDVQHANSLAFAQPTPKFRFSFAHTVPEQSQGSFIYIIFYQDMDSELFKPLMEFGVWIEQSVDLQVDELNVSFDELNVSFDGLNVSRDNMNKKSLLNKLNAQTSLDNILHRKSSKSLLPVIKHEQITLKRGENGLKRGELGENGEIGLKRDNLEQFPVTRHNLELLNSSGSKIAKLFSIKKDVTMESSDAMMESSDAMMESSNVMMESSDVMTKSPSIKTDIMTVRYKDDLVSELEKVDSVDGGSIDDFKEKSMSDFAERSMNNEDSMINGDSTMGDITINDVTIERIESIKSSKSIKSNHSIKSSKSNHSIKSFQSSHSIKSLTNSSKKAFNKLKKTFNGIKNKQSTNQNDSTSLFLPMDNFFNESNLSMGDLSMGDSFNNGQDNGNLFNNGHDNGNLFNSGHNNGNLFNNGSNSFNNGHKSFNNGNNNDKSFNNGNNNDKSFNNANNFSKNDNFSNNGNNNDNSSNLGQNSLNNGNNKDNSFNNGHFMANAHSMANFMPPNDGPAFRQHLQSLESYITAFRPLIKQYFKQTDLYLASLDHTNALRKAYTQTLAQLKTFLVSNNHNYDPELNSSISEILHRLSLETLHYQSYAQTLDRHLARSLKLLVGNLDQTATVQRRKYSDKNKEYYSWLNKYLASDRSLIHKLKPQSTASSADVCESTNCPEPSIITSHDSQSASCQRSSSAMAHKDVQFVRRRRSFELARLDYFNHLNDYKNGLFLHSFKLALLLFLNDLHILSLNTKNKLQSQTNQLSLRQLSEKISFINLNWSNLTQLKASQRLNISNASNNLELSSALLQPHELLHQPHELLHQPHELLHQPHQPHGTHGTHQPHQPHQPHPSLITNADQVTAGISANSGNTGGMHEGILWTYGGGNRHGWHKQWVVLDNGLLKEYLDWKSGKLLRGNPLDIRFGCIKLTTSEIDRRFCFEVITTKNEKRLFQAASAQDRDTWIAKLNQCLSLSVHSSHLEQLQLQQLHTSTSASTSTSTSTSASASAPSSSATHTHAHSHTSKQNQPSSDYVNGSNRASLRKNFSINSTRHTSTEINNSTMFGRNSKGFRKSNDADNMLHAATDTTVVSHRINNQYADTGTGTGTGAGTGADSELNFLQIVRQSHQSNHYCADCGATKSVDWISISLLVVVCIDCSGVHRSLGLHLSKIRSLTLDVSIFTPEIVKLLHSVNNEGANLYWECRMQKNRKHDMMHPAASASERSSFIINKYKEKKYIEEDAKLNSHLIYGIHSNNVHMILKSLACGGNPNMVVIKGKEKEIESSLLEYALTHYSGPASDPVFEIAELLLLNGANCGTHVVNNLNLIEPAKRFWQAKIDRSLGISTIQNDQSGISGASNATASASATNANASNAAAAAAAAAVVNNYYQSVQGGTPVQESHVTNGIASSFKKDKRRKNSSALHTYTYSDMSSNAGTTGPNESISSNGQGPKKNFHSQIPLFSFSRSSKKKH